MLIKELVKRTLLAALNVMGLELRLKPTTNPRNWRGRMYGVRSSLEQVLDHLVSLGFSPATVIDVGVAYGTPALYERFPAARHLLIEPLQEFEEHLKRICRRYPAEYVLAAAGATAGRAEMSLTPDLEGSSLFGEGGEKRCVPVITLDEICRARQLRGPFLLKVDAQGAELQVLEGAATILPQTEVVILEVSFFQFIEGFPEFYEVVDYMKKRGWVVYEIFGGHNRPLDGARAQADVVFVKENGPWRASHAWATAEQAAEFHRRGRDKVKAHLGARVSRTA